MSSAAIISAEEAVSPWRASKRESADFDCAVRDRIIGGGLVGMSARVGVAMTNSTKVGNDDFDWLNTRISPLHGKNWPEPEMGHSEGRRNPLC